MAGRTAALLLAGLVLAGCGEDSPEKTRFVAQCTGTVSRLDCGCFWDKAGDALAGANTGAVLQFMQVKNSYPAQTQKAQLVRLVGAAHVTTLWRASMQCSR